MRKVWLFTMVLGHSRWTWGSFCALQYLQTVLRCHIEPFAAMAGAPGLETPQAQAARIVCRAARRGRSESFDLYRLVTDSLRAGPKPKANRFRKEF